MDRELRNQSIRSVVASSRPVHVPMKLSDIPAHLQSEEMQARKVPGRTLPRGAQWTGHDIPGRGTAAARRLRQIQKKEVDETINPCVK